MPSYLIISPKNEAQLNAAFALTKRSLCSTGPRKACGKCVNCLGVVKKIHPDLHLLSLEPGKKQIGIDEVKSLILSIRYKPYLSRSQVAVIIGANSLTTEAQNALLKTLEEPPDNTDIILTTDDQHNVLPTIRSRCAPVLLKPRKSNQEAKPSASGKTTETQTDVQKDTIEIPDIQKLTRSTLVDRFLAIEELAKRDEHTNQRITTFLNELTQFYYSKLHEQIDDDSRTKSNSAVLKKIDQARHQISRNVNTRLALENLMLYIPLKESPKE